MFPCVGVDNRNGHNDDDDDDNNGDDDDNDDDGDDNDDFIPLSHENLNRKPSDLFEAVGTI